MAFLDAEPFAGGGDVLAGEAGREDLDRLDGSPVDGADVTEVGHTGHAGSQDLGDVRVGVGAPRDAAAAERGEHAEVQSAVPGAHRADDGAGGEIGRASCRERV